MVRRLLSKRKGGWIVAAALMCAVIGLAAGCAASPRQQAHPPRQHQGSPGLAAAPLASGDTGSLDRFADIPRDDEVDQRAAGLIRWPVAGGVAAGRTASTPTLSSPCARTQPGRQPRAAVLVRICTVGARKSQVREPRRPKISELEPSQAGLLSCCHAPERDYDGDPG
jgi:hypothetical protein